MPPSTKHLPSALSRAEEPDPGVGHVLGEPGPTQRRQTEGAEFTTTLAPLVARQRARAAPIPLDDPVTRATRPEGSVVRRNQSK
jgi:hypothetical protein